MTWWLGNSNGTKVQNNMLECDSGAVWHQKTWVGLGAKCLGSGRRPGDVAESMTTLTATKVLSKLRGTVTHFGRESDNLPGPKLKLMLSFEHEKTYTATP